MKTTDQPGPITTGTIDNPMCQCCEPTQPLEPPQGTKQFYRCPVTGKKYSFDPAEGVVREQAAATRETQTEVRDNRSSDPDFMPRTPSRGEQRQIDPSDTFA